MGDFDTANVLADWDGVLGTAGALTASTGGVTFSAIWAERQDVLMEMNDQLRDERRYTLFTTYTELPTRPTLRQTLVRAGVTYAVEGIRDDVAQAGIEFDVKRVI